MKRSLIRWQLPLCCLLIFYFTACRKETARTGNQSPVVFVWPSLQIPVVLIGGDTTVEATTTTLTLDGNASYSRNGIILSYDWVQLAGPNHVSFSNSYRAKTVVSNLIIGNYWFRLVVSDDHDVTARAAKKVVVGNSDELFYEDLVWASSHNDDTDKDVAYLVSPEIPELFGSGNPSPKPLNANVYVKFDTASNWLEVPHFTAYHQDFYYYTNNSRLVITDINPNGLNGRKASMKIKFR